MYFEHGTRLHYDRIGPADGPVVCLLHGLMGDIGLWAELAGPLAATGYQVLRLDLPGHGGSSASADYGMESTALLVEAFLAEASPEPVRLVGLSLGGIVAQAIAIERRLALRSLTLCATMSSSPADPNQTWRERVRAIEAGGSLDGPAAGGMERWLGPGFRQAHRTRWGELHRAATGMSPAAYAGFVSAINQFDYRPKLSQIGAPCLVICGSDDAACPPAEGRRIADAIPGAGFALIDETRHFPNVEQPERFNRVMLEWLARG